MNRDIVTLREVSVHFPSRSGFLGKAQVVHALDEVSLTVREGEILGIVGESGCGKSTLGRVILGLLQPTHGSIEMNGQPIPRNARPGTVARQYGLQMVFQDPASSLNPRMRVGASIAEPLAGLNLTSSQTSERIRELLNDVDLDPDYANKYPEELSGGQQQRVAIARALAPRPRLIVLDEAVSALDMSTQATVLNLLKDLKEKHAVTYLFISHDISTVKFMSTRIVVMYLGQIVEITTPDHIDQAALHPYTICLRSAVPIPDVKLERSRVHIIPEGPLPSPLAPPPGCRFHTRCPIAQANCTHEVPPLIQLDEQRFAACHYAGQFEQMFDPTRERQDDPALHPAIG